MNKLSWLSRILIVGGAVLILAAVYYPIWRIELDAPQYPEGLCLYIYAHEIGGDIDIINGLNHYIGMATIHSEEFVEFAVLPYIFWGFFGLGLLVAALNRKKIFYAYVGLFVLFAVVAMADFYAWEYKYGHNLDPNAPIQVPGMAYQPPLIGFKQLLNFGAYSIPDTGGWALVASGLLFCIGVTIEVLRAKQTTMKSLIKTNTVKNAAAVMVLMLFMSCKTGPVAINMGKDCCDHCKMVIMDNKFCSEIVTSKGKIYKFDDLTCMSAFSKTEAIKNADGYTTYVADYNGTGLFPGDSACFVKSSMLRGPMGGNICAFKDAAAQQAGMAKLNGSAATLADVMK